MRLLVDENLSVRVARRLADADHDAVHVTEVGLGNTDDLVIFDWAADQSRIVVTSDPTSVRCLRLVDERVLRWSCCGPRTISRRTSRPTCF